ncbi:tRNA (guanosine(37)-N1)-methyltransferase TrmD [Spirochaetia bacterium 38H-sp]|uniref:tRNA (guanine-N(1)-)-methyltransferase n=1 Tax=Rarispira pelagica TaxID=3141764 RepID=A0ABU9UBN8_9SPIR
MKINILTLFPEIVRPYFTNSIPAKAIEKDIFSVDIVNIRDFALDKHRTCDDEPYGGGAGMVLKPEPVSLALEKVTENLKTPVIIYPSPAGIPFDQSTAYELSKEKELVFLCGRYEGLDQRIIDYYDIKEYSIGDYVLSAGELAALVIVDAVIRLIDGVITNESLREESFSSGLLEYPHYTRPAVFKGVPVPDVLLSGHHENIRQWRLRKSIERTLDRRPDLLHNKALSEEEKAILENILEERGRRNERDSGN